METFKVQSEELKLFYDLPFTYQVEEHAGLSWK